MKLLIFVLVVLVLAVALRIGAGYLSAQKKNTGIADGALTDCPDKPNCVSSMASRESQKIEPLVISGDPQQTLDTLVDTIESMAGTTIVERGDNSIHATVATRVLGFIDDVYFLYQPGQSVIEVKSLSRLGHMDFGVNRKRVDEIRLRLGQVE